MNIRACLGKQGLPFSPPTFTCWVEFKEQSIEKFENLGLSQIFGHFLRKNFVAIDCTVQIYRANMPDIHLTLLLNLSNLRRHTVWGKWKFCSTDPVPRKGERGRMRERERLPREYSIWIESNCSKLLKVHSSEIHFYFASFLFVLFLNHSFCCLAMSLFQFGKILHRKYFCM